MKIGIIGAGASGLIASIRAGRDGHQVYLFEHNDRVGKKLLSTGNGRCNLSNEDMDIKHFHGADQEFVSSVLSQFNTSSTLDFFKTIGLYTKNKRGYLYPNSEQASAVLDALRFEVSRLNNIDLLLNSQITNISKSKNSFIVYTDQQSYKFDRLIICCGSRAVPKSGSDGSGYDYAKMLGHTIIKPLPALTSLKSTSKNLKQLAGVRTEGIVKLYANDTILDEQYGEIQFTKEYISGIPVFQLSYKAAKELDKKNKVVCEVDFVPHMNSDDIVEYIALRSKCLMGHGAGDLLTGLINKNISQCLAKEIFNDVNYPIDKISRKQILEYSKLLKNFRFTITETNSFDNCQVCYGGVNTSEINKKTLESKIVNGLYFAGEILNVNGDCGGYNLQWAWSTGYICGGINRD